MRFSFANTPMRILAIVSVFAVASCTDSVSPPKPAKLAFVVQPPASIVAGSAIRPDISVAIQDENGNTVTDASDEITISLASNPAEGKLAGPLTRNAVNGIATFTDLFINKAGTGYTLSATVANSGLTAAISTPLEVKPGQPQSMSFVTQPSTSVAGSPLAQISIAIKDASGNTVNTATNQITLTLAGNSSGATLVGNSVSAAAAGGVATFSGISILKAGSDYRLFALSGGLGQTVSQSFSILPGPPIKLVFTKQPEATPAGDVINSIAVEVQDAFGNRASATSPSVKIALGANPSGATLSGTTSVSSLGGVAAFNDLRIDKAGTNYTLVATTTDVESGTSVGFSIRSVLLVTAASAGYFHACGIEVGGAAYCWGDNSAGQLGNPAPQMRTTPANVSGNISFRKIGAGRNHSCGLSTDGRIYCWGDNGSFQLGSTTAGSNAPIAIASALEFADISAGYDHSCGVTSTGDGYCWGSGASGELGNDAFTAGSNPVRVSGGLAFTNIGAGRFFTCGATTDRKAYCWGDNTSGQLGNGTNASAGKPVTVGINLSFAFAAAGGFHSCGLTTTGAAYCWGNNASGQLGSGNTANSSLPVEVVGGHVFVSLSVGNRHTCGVTASGDGYCWGENSTLALGDGTAVSSSSPVPVTGIHNFATISAGRFHSCGVTKDGSAYCWGSNGNGYLGNGTTASSGVPVRVR